MESAATIAKSSRISFGVVVVYGAAALQGLAVVSFPASSAELQRTYGLSDSAYGSLFLPQMIFTILGSLAGAALARRVGLRALLGFSLVCAMGSQICLRSVTWIDADSRLYVLLLGTAAMGTGFGVAAAPLNALPGLLFPRRSGVALVALHTMIAGGFALGPLAVSALVASHAWPHFPASLSLVSLVFAIAAASTTLPAALPPKGARSGIAWGPLAIFVAIAIIYAIAEGTFANWAIVFLTDERNVPQEIAAIALASFWAALAGGRLLISALLVRVSATTMWIALPFFMIAVLLALPLTSGGSSGIVLFALAGFACSAFFPLTVEIASQRAGDASQVSSALIAALMVGVGGGSFVLGTLRGALELPTIYRLSALEPALVLVLAALALRMRRTK